MLVFSWNNFPCISELMFQTVVYRLFLINRRKILLNFLKRVLMQKSKWAKFYPRSISWWQWWLQISSINQMQILLQCFVALLMKYSKHSSVLYAHLKVDRKELSLHQNKQLIIFITKIHTKRNPLLQIIKVHFITPYFM